MMGELKVHHYFIKSSINLTFAAILRSYTIIGYVKPGKTFQH